MIRTFIGYDSREAAAFSVLAHSIHRRASQPVAIAPLKLEELQGVFSRERDPLQSTEFSFTRFLVPYLCDYQGWAIFTDCDMIVRDDIANLWSLRDERYAVQVVKHHHVPKEEVKFLGSKQSKYEKKNWSSVMLINCGKCRALTPEFVNTASGLQLHQFKWLASDDLIGALPAKWNHLVGYDAPDPHASLVHFTIGGPYFEEYKDCEYSREWFEERDAMLKVAHRQKAAA
jgi:lipopolysaccharide biosynthesis glycosyltransferase